MKHFLLLILLGTLAASCKKKVTCTGNCADIRITGRMYDAVTNQGFANQPVEVYWNHNGFCIFCSSKKVYKGKTDGSGNFDFTVSIDTSLFNDNHLSIGVNNPAGYLDNERQTTTHVVYDYPPGGVSNAQFPFYPAANLVLRLHRNLADSFRYFGVEHSYISNYTIVSYIISSPAQARDTVINTQTAAGLYTRIKRRKTTAPGVFTEQIDSLICTKAGPNVFDIVY